MSDLGLYASLYEQLRNYADQIDHALVNIRSEDKQLNEKARKQLAGLLKEINEEDTTRPAAKLVAFILREELPQFFGKKRAVWETLSKALEKGNPDKDQYCKLEQIASVIDRECISTRMRMEGRL